MMLDSFIIEFITNFLLHQRYHACARFNINEKTSRRCIFGFPFLLLFLILSWFHCSILSVSHGNNRRTIKITKLLRHCGEKNNIIWIFSSSCNWENNERIRPFYYSTSGSDIRVFLITLFSNNVDKLCENRSL